jgi:hypothetical protein
MEDERFEPHIQSHYVDAAGKVRYHITINLFTALSISTMKSIVNVLAVVALTVTVAMTAPAPEPKHTLKPGWTTEQFHEYLSLNTTEGLEGMANVTYYEVTELGEVIDFGASNFEKRDGSRDFQGWSGRDCHGTLLFEASNFNCGVCVTTTTAYAQSGWLWRGGLKNPYPTADWFRGPRCTGAFTHHQAPGPGYASCDNAEDFGVLPFASAMLYQAC